MLVRFDFHQKALFFQVFHDLLTALVAGKPLVFAGVFVHNAAVVHHADDVKVMTKPDFKVVGIVSGGDFHRARTETYLAIVVGDKGNFTPDDRQNQRFAQNILVSFVLRVDRNRRIAKERFGTSRRDDDIFVAVLHGVTDMPEETVLFGIFDFRVGKRGMATGAPVDNPVAAVNKTFFIKADENFLHCRRQIFVHCERLFRPVARRAEAFLLFDDSAAVLMRPCPGSFKEAVATDVVFRESFRLHLVDDFEFRRDACVVGAGKPQRFVAVHTLKADDNILNGIIEGVSHVQLSRDVGRRHHNRERLFLFVDVSLKEFVFHPVIVDFLFETLRLISFFHIHNTYH